VEEKKELALEFRVVKLLHNGSKRSGWKSHSFPIFILVGQHPHWLAESNSAVLSLGPSGDRTMTSTSNTLVLVLIVAVVNRITARECMPHDVRQTGSSWEIPADCKSVAFVGQNLGVRGEWFALFPSRSSSSNIDYSDQAHVNLGLTGLQTGTCSHNLRSQSCKRK
jgi:hypothetical protein